MPFPKLSGKGNYALTAASSIALTAGPGFQKNTGREASLTYGAGLSESVQADVRQTAGKNHSHVVGAKYRLDAHEGIHIRCGLSELIMKPDGTVMINGKDMTTIMSGNIEESAAGAIKLNASKIELN